MPLPPSQNVVTADVADNGDGTYAVSHAASLAGVYELHITMGECHDAWLACRAQLACRAKLACRAQLVCRAQLACRAKLLVAGITCCRPFT